MATDNTRTIDNYETVLAAFESMEADDTGTEDTAEVTEEPSSETEEVEQEQTSEAVATDDATETDDADEAEVEDDTSEEDVEDADTDNEDTDDDAEEPAEDSEVQTVTVKVNGVEEEISLDEAVRRAQMGTDYHRRLNDLNQERTEFESEKEQLLQIANDFQSLQVAAQEDPTAFAVDWIAQSDNVEDDAARVFAALAERGAIPNLVERLGLDPDGVLAKKARDAEVERLREENRRLREGTTAPEDSKTDDGPTQEQLELVRSIRSQWDVVVEANDLGFASEDAKNARFREVLEHGAENNIDSFPKAYQSLLAKEKAARSAAQTRAANKRKQSVVSSSSAATRSSTPKETFVDNRSAAEAAFRALQN